MGESFGAFTIDRYINWSVVGGTTGKEIILKNKKKIEYYIDSIIFLFWNMFCFTEMNSLTYHPNIIKNDIIKKRYLFSDFLENKVLYKKKYIYLWKMFSFRITHFPVVPSSLYPVTNYSVLTHLPH